jgi:hypothetical protein
MGPGLAALVLAMALGPGLLQGEGDDGGVGEQVGADGLAQAGQLLGPVAGRVGVQVQAGVDLGLAVTWRLCPSSGNQELLAIVYPSD